MSYERVDFFEESKKNLEKEIENIKLSKNLKTYSIEEISDYLKSFNEKDKKINIIEISDENNFQKYTKENFLKYFDLKGNETDYKRLNPDDFEQLEKDTGKELNHSLLVFQGNGFINQIDYDVAKKYIDFKKQIPEKGVGVLILKTKTCKHCKPHEKKIKEIMNERNDFKFVSVYLDENETLKNSFKSSLTEENIPWAFPADMFYKDGKIFYGDIGDMSKEKFNVILDSINKSKTPQEAFKHISEYVKKK